MVSSRVLIFSVIGPNTINIVNDIWNKSYMNCGNEMKVKKWSSQWKQFMQLRKEAWKKFRTSTGFEPVTSLAFSGFFTQLHKLLSLRWSFLHFHNKHSWDISNVHGFPGRTVTGSLFNWLLVELELIWECWFYEERGNPKYKKKNLSEQGREPAKNSIHIWRWPWELNPGHIGGR